MFLCRGGALTDLPDLYPNAQPCRRYFLMMVVFRILKHRMEWHVGHLKLFQTDMRDHQFGFSPETIDGRLLK